MKEIVQRIEKDPQLKKTFDVLIPSLVAFTAAHFIIKYYG
jgi:hypothetical protein